jgi:hypothetical protein
MSLAHDDGMQQFESITVVEKGEGVGNLKIFSPPPLNTAMICWWHQVTTRQIQPTNIVSSMDQSDAYVGSR